MKENKDRPIKAVFALVAIAVTAVAFAVEEGIVQNGDGDYIITFRSETSGQMIHWLWVPSTKIDPTVVSTVVQSTTPGLFSYNYIITNSSTSRQNLAVVRLTATSAVSKSQASPTGWHGSVRPDLGRSSGTVVGWAFLDGDLKPGVSQDGFGVESHDLPGIGFIELSASPPDPALVQISPPSSYIDEDISDTNPLYDQFVDLQMNDFVFRPTAVPRFPIPNPFDASQLLTVIKNHLDTDLVNLQMVDPRLLSQLDRNLQSAIDAATSNDTKALKRHIDHALRIVSSHKAKVGGIDAQAATVLRFDLQYVASRL